MTAPLDYSRLTGFTNNPLDRRSEQRGDPALMDAARADARARCFLLIGDRVFMAGSDPAQALFDLGAATAHGADPAGLVLLGWDRDGAPRLAAALPAEPPAAAALTAVDLRSLAAAVAVDDETLGPLAQARSILSWNQRHGFCSNCGTATVSALGGYRRDCPTCGTQHFPRVDPVVIMLISDGERALLGRQPRFRTGSYSCLAGFVEPGETIEDAVRRESFEEAGVRVGRVTYHASQPWPFVSSLMIGCLAEATTTDLVIDRAELEDCRWFGRDEVAAMLEERHPEGFYCPPKLAIARRLVEQWLAPL